MKKVLFIMPYNYSMQRDIAAIIEENSDIEFVEVNSFKNLYKDIKEMTLEGLEIVAARGIQAISIEKQKLNVAVVPIHMTIFDVFEELKLVTSKYSKIAIALSREKPIGFDMLPYIFDTEIKYYYSEDSTDIPDTIQRAINEGAEFILSDPIGCRTAQKLKIDSSIIKIKYESMKLTINEIRQIQTTQEIDITKHGFYKTILDNSLEGIITIDRNSNITAINPSAQKLIGFKEIDVLGKNAINIVPNLNLNEYIDNNKGSYNEIITINNKEIMCTRIPIEVNKNSVGAIATFHETETIQKMEHVIRKKLYIKGHIANASFSDLTGESVDFKKAISMAKTFAKTDSNILINGETGTGKELFAQSIHNHSKKALGPFIVINCAALPPNILESELFGYVGGAFTGANKAGKPGLFEVAHTGTVFLDEISEMDYLNQGRLLRVLQEKNVVRLGSDTVIPIDVRVIAASNKDLIELVRENKFRNDLYFRLNVLTLNLPPLKNRNEDILLLANFSLMKFNEKYNKNLSFSKDALSLLNSYDWPGNVRELYNIIERAVIISNGTVITEELLDTIGDFIPKKSSLLTYKEETQVNQIKEALIESNGNISEAANILNIDRSTLYRRIKKYNL